MLEFIFSLIISLFLVAGDGSVLFALRYESIDSLGVRPVCKLRANLRSQCGLAIKVKAPISQRQLAWHVTHLAILIKLSTKLVLILKVHYVISVQDLHSTKQESLAADIHVSYIRLG